MVSFTPRPLYPQGKSPWYLLLCQLYKAETMYDNVFVTVTQTSNAVAGGKNVCLPVDGSRVPFMGYDAVSTAQTINASEVL